MILRAASSSSEVKIKVWNVSLSARACHVRETTAQTLASSGSMSITERTIFCWISTGREVREGMFATTGKIARVGVRMQDCNFTVESTSCEDILWLL